MIKRLINLGVDEQLTGTENKLVRLLNIFCLTWYLAITIFIITDYFFEEQYLFTWAGHLFQFFFLVVVQYYQSKKKYTLARSIFIGISFLQMFTFCNFILPGRLIEFYFIMIPLFSLLFLKKWVYHIFFLLLIIISFIIPAYLLDNYDTNSFNTTNLPIVFSVVFLLVYYFKDVNERNEKLLELQKNNIICKTYACNLENSKEVLELIPTIQKDFSKIDLLINNAGISQRSKIIDTDISVYKKLVDINYLGTVALTKAVLPYFVKAKNGHFATITSLMGKFAGPQRSGYCGAKHALHGFFDVLRMEHEKDNINVTLICPGYVQTNIDKNALTADGSAQEKHDAENQNGLPVAVFAMQMIRAIERKKYEAYMGKKEVMGVYLKRFFPKLLHRVVLKSTS